MAGKEPSEPRGELTLERNLKQEVKGEDLFQQFLYERLKDQGGSTLEEGSDTSLDLPVDQGPIENQELARVSLALRQLGDEQTVIRRGFLTPLSSVPGKGRSALTPQLGVEDVGLLMYLYYRYKIWSDNRKTEGYSLDDLIDQFASIETSTENFSLLFLVKVFYGLPIQKCVMHMVTYLMVQWLLFTSQREERRANQRRNTEVERGRIDVNEAQWEFITDTPRELVLQENEAIISSGVKFSPSGAKLSKPLKVTLDHNAYFSHPTRAEIVFYTRSNDLEPFERIPSSVNGYPRCEVRTKDLDFFVDHFSEWWIVAVFTRYFIGKRINCTPFFRPPARKGFSHIMLLCLYDDLTEVIKKVKEEMSEYRKLFPPQPMFIEWKCGDINIELLDGPKDNEKRIDEAHVDEQDFQRLDRRQLTFDVMSSVTDPSQRFFRFKLKQVRSLSSSPTMLRFILPYDDPATTTAAASTKVARAKPAAMTSAITTTPATALTTATTAAMVAAAATPAESDLKADAILDRLAKYVPVDAYTTLCINLGIGFNEAEGIADRFNRDYQRAMRYCFAQWKTKTGGDMEELKDILQEAEIGDLVKYIY
ncbi:uncharacterized protein LOC129272730 isoform X2 [Lytechinus pictus]|uniref:uncharacterized protein LOC129272730 isoform X2 n=1 Tax=Lytechinus pictus TaxID=7653 RepID=UPI0030B9E472